MALFKNIGKKAEKTASKIADLFTYTPEEEAEGKKKTKLENTTTKISDYFKPSAEKTRVRDVIREVPKATYDVGKEIAQGTARSLDFAGRKVLNTVYKPLEKITGVDFTSNLKDLSKKEDTTLDRVLFGSNTKREDSLDKLAEEEVGINAEKHPLLATIIGGTLVGADMIPGGQGKAKGVIKGLKITADEISVLAKTKGPKNILKILVNGGVDAKTAENLVGDITKATKTADVKKIIEGGVKPEVSRETPVKAVAESVKLEGLDPKEYTNFEDFRKATYKNFNDSVEMGEKRGWSKRLDEGYKSMDNEKIYTDAYEMPFKDYIKKYEAYDINGGGGSTGTKDAHAVISKEYLEPTEADSWSTFRDDFTEPFDKKVTNQELKKYDKDFIPVSVEERNGVYYVTDGHHRVANNLRDGAGEIPVYLSSRDLQKIWEKANGQKISLDESKNVYEELFPKAPSLKSIQETWEKSNNVGDVTKKGERRFTSRVRTMAEELTPLLDGQKDVRSTEKLIEQADELIAKDLTEALAIARQGDSDLSVAIASRYIDESVKKAKAMPTGGEKLKLWDEIARVANETAEALTEHGRAIQSASILGKMTPEGMVRYVATKIKTHNRNVEQALEPGARSFLDNFKRGKVNDKVPELNAEDAKEIAEAMQEALDQKTPLEVAKAIRKVLDEKVNPKVPESLYSKLVTLWKAGLLTGLKTTGLNVASNTAHTGTEILKDVPGVLVDKVISLFTGKRSLGFTTKNQGKGMKEGVTKGWDYFKTGFDERDIGAKLDYKNISFGESKFAKALQTYEETIFRSLGAQDQPMYYGAKARSMYSQAIAQAKNAGLKGQEAKTFIENLVANPTDEMLKYALLDAETAVFQNKTALGDAAKVFQQKIPGGEVVLPFGKTPSAVATQLVNYSPIGIVKTIVQNIGKGKFDQRLFSQGMGRAITGTGAMYIGMKLGLNDMVTTSYPQSEKERELWELEGRQSNSIKINGKWRSPAVLGPIGYALVMGAYVQEGIEETGSFVGGLASSIPGTLQILTDQTFLSGINQAMEAVMDPKRSWNGYASSMAGSIVPTLISDIARSIDSNERRTATPMQRIKSRIPGLRQTLEPKVNAFGEEVETPAFFTTLLNPTRPTEPTTDLNDPVLKEMQKLRDEGYLVAPAQLGPSKGYKSLSPEENTKLWRIAGMAGKNQVDQLMKMKGWNDMDGEQKERTISNSIQDITTEARARIVVEAVSDLEGNEKKKRLKEMVEDGLLTKSVYKIYVDLENKL